MKSPHTRGLLDAILDRSLAHLGVWAHQVNRNQCFEIAPHSRPTQIRTVDWEVVARGIWRVTGGQSMDRPLGFTEPMADQLSRALSDMDAEELTPATASAVVQVGLYGEVRFRQT